MYHFPSPSRVCLPNDMKSIKTTFSNSYHTGNPVFQDNNYKPYVGVQINFILVPNDAFTLQKKHTNTIIFQSSRVAYRQIHLIKTNIKKGERIQRPAISAKSQQIYETSRFVYIAFRNYPKTIEGAWKKYISQCRVNMNGTPSPAERKTHFNNDGRDPAI